MPSVSLRLSLRLPPRWSGEQAQALTQALQQWPQVTALLRGEELHLTYDPDRVSILDLQQTAAEQGATFTPPFLRVEGQLSPPPDGDEAARLEKRLAKFPGVVWAGVNFASAQAVVEGTLDETAVAALRSHLRRWGYDFDLSPLVTAAPGAVPPPERRASRVRRREWLWVALAAVALLLGWALEHLEGATRAARTAYVLSLLGSGGRFAWQVLRSQNLSGRGWILLAALGVLALGEWWEAALTMLGGAVGWAATEGLGERVRRAIGRERVLFAETVRRLTPDEERYCLAEELRPGDRFAVRPGEIIGADGQVVEGTSSVDEVALKGTSTPRKVSPGDFVCAGTLNQEGQLVVEAQRTGADTLWARRSRHLALATVFSLPADQWFARLGTALLLLLTAGLAGAPWLLGNLEPTTGYLRAWAGVALISAVGWRRSSQAVAVAVALVRLFRRGIWSRGGAVLETMPCTEVAVFEGAGVLTTGRPEEIDPVSLSPRDPQDILRLAAALARASSEPVAQAIVERARRERLARPRASSVRAVPGRGMQGDIAGRWHYLGGLSFARDLGLEAPEAKRRAAAGETVWLLMTEREVLGLIVVPNPVRETAAQTVAALKRPGRRSVVVGEDETALRALTAQVGADEYWVLWQVEERLAALAEQRRRGRRVLWVAGRLEPTLWAADVGVLYDGLRAEAETQREQAWAPGGVLEVPPLTLLTDTPKGLQEAEAVGEWLARGYRRMGWGWGLALTVLAVLVGGGWLSLPGVVWAEEALRGATLLFRLHPPQTKV